MFKLYKKSFYFIFILFLLLLFLILNFYIINYSKTSSTNYYNGQNSFSNTKNGIRNSQFNNIYDNSGNFFTKGYDNQVINNSGKSNYVGNQQNVKIGGFYQNEFYLNLQSNSEKKINANKFTDNLIGESEFGYVSGAPVFLQYNLSTSNYKNDYSSKYNITFNFPSPMTSIGINKSSIGFENLNTDFPLLNFQSYQVAVKNSAKSNIQTRDNVLYTMTSTLGSLFHSDKNEATIGGTSPSNDGTSMFRFIIVKSGNYVYFYICSQDNRYRSKGPNFELERILFFRVDVETLRKLFSSTIVHNNISYKYMPPMKEDNGISHGDDPITDGDNPITDLTVNLMTKYEKFDPEITTQPTPTFCRSLIFYQLSKALTDNSNLKNPIDNFNIFGFGPAMSNKGPYFNKSRYLEKPLLANTEDNNYWINGGNSQEGGKNLMIKYNYDSASAEKIQYKFIERYITRLFSSYGGDVNSDLTNNNSFNGSPNTTSLDIVKIPMLFVSDFGYDIDDSDRSKNPYGVILDNSKPIHNFIFSYPLYDPNITLSNNNGDPYSYNNIFNYLPFYIGLGIVALVILFAIITFVIFFFWDKKKKKQKSII